jgi:DNA topoisomerase-1
VKIAISAVAKILGNTPTICRKCYVHPAVLETYLDGTLVAGLKSQTEQALAHAVNGLRSEERAVLIFLQERLARK